MSVLSVPLVIPGHSAESCPGSETGTDDLSLWSGATEADEGLEVSQQMMESLLLGAGTQLENEEYLMGISRRLQTALEKMLMAISDTTSQVQTVGTNVQLVFRALLGYLALFSCSTVLNISLKCSAIFLQTISHTIQ